jgi:hypothetical protein
VFGDVPNVALLAARIHAVALGRPRDCMALAQYLLERGAITYAAGTWTLPEQLQVADLPRRATDVFRARVAALQPLARTLLQQHALALTDTFSRDDYLRLNSSTNAGQIDAAISELLSLDLLRSDGRTYALAVHELREIAKEGLGDAAHSRLHRELSVLAYKRGHCIEAVSHLLSADLASEAIDLLFQTFTAADEPQNLINFSLLPFQEIARVIEDALDAAAAIQRNPRDVYELTRWLFLASVAAEDRMHARTAPVLLERLVRDSGLALYRQLDDTPDPGQRLMQALTRATEQYNATPEPERVYRVDESLTHLVYYAAVSIAVGSRTMDGALLESLPGLLEPFAPLSPAIHAIWQNTIATLEISSGNPERAYERWIKLYEQLADMNGTELKRVDLIRSAIAYGLGMIDAQVGRDAVGDWAAVLDQDPLQQVNACYLRRALCLHRGDMQSAERFRRKAEVLAVQANIRQMFATVSVVELNIAAMMRDLTGVKQLADRIVPLAAAYPGWQPFRELADAHLHRLRGNLDAAGTACERALALVAPEGVLPSTSILCWWSTTALYIEVLTELGRHEEALSVGERALTTCAERGVGGATADIQRATAIAQAKLGDLEGAAARLDAAIATQNAYGGHGLILGASYEARARVAIWSGDAAGVQRYGELAAHEYRHGRTTPLGARYERLTHEARAAGLDVLPQLESIASTHVGPTALGGVRATVEPSVTAALRRAEDARSRAHAAIELICEAHVASGGHLYVMRRDGLGLAASLGAGPPDAELTHHVTSFWERHLRAADEPTVFVPEPQTLSPGSTTVGWSDVRGVSYQPVLISALVAGDRVYVGVAALIAGAHPNAHPNAPQITTSIGALLLDAGDAVAVEA